MKYLFQRTYIIILLTLISTVAFGARSIQKIGNIYYLLSDDGAIVTYGSNDNTPSATAEYTGQMDIPASVTDDMGSTYVVTAIDSYAFFKCTGLTSVTMPNTVKTIGQSAFNSSGLTSVVISNGVTNIGISAFGYCTSLTSVTIGSSVSNIADEAFYKDPLTSVASLASQPPVMGSNVFSTYSFTLTVPTGSKDRYSVDETWSKVTAITEYSSIKASSIFFSKTKKFTLVSKTIQQAPTILPADAARQPLRWYSSDDTIATVNSSGDVSTISKGDVTITVETTDSSNLSASYKVYVFEPGIPGDVNGDGEITIADANEIVNMFLTK